MSFFSAVGFWLPRPATASFVPSPVSAAFRSRSAFRPPSLVCPAKLFSPSLSFLSSFTQPNSLAFCPFSAVSFCPFAFAYASAGTFAQVFHPVSHTRPNTARRQSLYGD
ncbi:hypothetical protein HDK77DRAFT_441033 [Phyllosticta capitalensis]